MRINFSLVVLFVSILAMSGTTFMYAGEQQLQLLEQANAAVEMKAKLTATDPLRPIFHLQTKANWINDPNGPIYFHSEYHIFFQHNPYGAKWGNMSWGHAVSSDLVHWRHLPIVLTPQPDGYDKDGVFSGCCVDDNGVMTIVYTGVSPQVQCIARSHDNGRTFEKYQGNPVIAAPPVDNVEGFRDPFVWKNGDWWYVVIGSGIKGEGGTAFLYRSKNLESWEYLNRIATGFGVMWECPNFFPLGDKWLLAVSPYGECKYTVGDFDGRHFTPTQWRRMDLGGRAGFYAPNCLVDEKGRRIIWGWITGGGSEGYPWNGMLTLPRVLSLRDDGRLGVEPLPELARLRTAHRHWNEMIVAKDSVFVLPEFKSRTFEMIVEFDPSGTSRFGVEVLRSDDGGEKQMILFDNENLTLHSGDKSGEFQLLPDEKSLKLHIFVDRSVIEVFANNRVCLTRRVYPKNENALGVALFSIGRSALVKRVDVWEMETIWKE